MITASFAAMIIGFALILVSATAKNERWQVAYGIVGLIFIFWAFGFFGLGRVVRSLMPALMLVFGMFSFYTKGHTQLICILLTIALFFQIFYV